jgi:hypothetical protein
MLLAYYVLRDFISQFVGRILPRYETPKLAAYRHARYLLVPWETALSK